MNVQSKIKSILNEGVKKKDFVGASYGIYINQHRYLGVTGYLDHHYKEKVKPYTLYDVASLTKVIVTTPLILKLIDDKKLSFYTEIKSILKDFKYQDITIKDLLIHGSGLPADIISSKTLKSKEELIERIYKAEVIYPKHSKIVYSDIGFLLLGLIIEKMYQMPINEVAENYIFKPLHMYQSTFRPKRIFTAPTEYRKDSVYQGLLKGKVHDEKAFAANGLTGHAGLFSTSNDILKFIQAILSNKFIFSNEMVDLMFQEQLVYKTDKGDILRRALGFQKPSLNMYFGSNYIYEDTIGHTGFTGCHLIIDRKRQIGVVVLSNAVHPYRDLNKIFTYRKRISDSIFT